MKARLEADVVVVGFGGAGASAAISARDAGASVVVLERSRQGGGNTRHSGGSLRSLADPARAVPYFEALTLHTTPPAVLAAYADGLAPVAEWLRGLGATVIEPPTWHASFPKSFPDPYPGLTSDRAVGGRLRVRSLDAETAGEALWSVLDAAVRSRDIEVAYEARALRLLQDRADGSVSGVVAETPAGEAVVRARKGVVLACGGFAWDVAGRRELMGLDLPVLGPSGLNSGDGVRMAQAVGADLWHMNASAVALGYRPDGMASALTHRMPNAAYIYVDEQGERFINETGWDFHTLPMELLRFDYTQGRPAHVVSFVIFDETARAAGPITNVGLLGSRQAGWSADNLREVERGWIARADTVEELAARLGLPGAALASTVAAYNAACRGGLDPRFGRVDLLRLEAPPFYGIRLWPVLVNTQGGPRRDERAQVLDPFGRPIPGLYAAGELGSIWGVLYPGGGNVGEALVFGRIAGTEAARR